MGLTAPLAAQFTPFLTLTTRCSEGAETVRGANPNDRGATREPANAAVAQGTEHPRRANARRGGIAVEASPNTPYNPKI